MARATALWAVALPLTALICRDEDMREVLASGRASATPDAAVWVKAREDRPGLWEIADGHHRVAYALRSGTGVIRAELDPAPDDEPLNGPFYDFGEPTPTDTVVRAAQSPRSRTAFPSMGARSRA